MLQQIFTTVIGLSITASIMIAIVLLLRICFQKKYGLVKGSAFVIVWMLILLRLCIPIHFQEAFFFQGREAPSQIVYRTFVEKTIGAQQMAEDITLLGNMPEGSNLLNDAFIGETHTIGDPIPENSTQQKLLMLKFRIVDLMTYLWIVGTLFFLIFTGLSYFKTMLFIKKHYSLKEPDDSIITLVQNLKSAIGIKQEIHIKLGNQGETFVYGFLKPTVVLDSGCIGSASLLLTHELIHIKRKDNFIKLLARVCLCIHWFNPFVWVAVKTLIQDMEIACDEKVLSVAGYVERGNYANAIYKYAVKKNLNNVETFVGFGKHSISKRIKHVLKVSEKSFSIPLISLALTLFMLTGCMANPIGAITGKMTEVETTRGHRLDSSFLDIPIPYEDQYDLVDYAYDSGKLYWVLSDNQGEETVYHLVVTDEGGEIFKDWTLHEERQIVGNIYIEKDILYYFAQMKDDLQLWQWNLADRSQKLIYYREEMMQGQEPTLWGSTQYLTWYEGSQLVVFNRDTGIERARIDTDGTQSYSPVLDGFVAYSCQDPSTGATLVCTYKVETGAVFSVESLLGSTYSVYGNSEYIVYKEEFKSGADIAVCDLSTGESASLWDLLQEKLPYSLVDSYKMGKWGISLLQDQLVLTGDGQKILVANLKDKTVTEIQGVSLGLGYYQPKNSNNQVSAMKYDSQRGQVKETGEIYIGRMVSK